jgi:hypothetical protein
MLKDILSISGKPGLYKLIVQKENMFVVESLTDKKRIPVYLRDKAMSLGDIKIYTEEEGIPLSVVLTGIRIKENGEPILFSPNIQPDELRKYFEQILPAYDQEKVYPSDIKKIMNWYNLLLKEGIPFENEENETKE